MATRATAKQVGMVENLPKREYDAIIIGSGPNGLAAAITMAQARCSVLVIEGQDEIGGGTRSRELTLPGFLHDVCSAVHPMAVASPFFQSLPLADHGLEWIHPPSPLAHPLDNGSAVIVDRSIERTAENLGRDTREYIALMSPLVRDWPNLISTFLAPPLRLPRHPISAARFACSAMRSASSFARKTFRGEKARALFAGLAAHAILPLEQIPTAAFGLVFAITQHAVGWPIPRGGAQRIADALASYFRSLDGEIVTGTMIGSLDELPKSRAVLCDVTPRQLLRIAGSKFPSEFRRRLESFRYGPGACKMDWALDGPIPWTAPACAQAATVHIGGTLEEIEAAERAPWQGQESERPFVLLSQPTLFDSTRAPNGKHVAWAYCHVPNGSSVDMTKRIENQIERFAPGFRSLILKRAVITASQLESYNPNLIGGDISGGTADLAQLFFRPTARGYRTPAEGVYTCSASTSPGAGVHGMCGYWAARTALRDLFKS